MNTMEILKPAMTDREIGLLDTYLDQCQGTYFEFGGGGSTFRACMYPNINHITVVESSPLWIDKLASNPLINISHRKHRVEFIHARINADDYNLGRPKDKSMIHNWPNYSRAISETHQPYDLVLIDGRFRVACALHTLEALSPHSYVLIHDYVNRPQYHIIEQFYETVTSVDTLTVFKKRPHYNAVLCREYLSKYEYIYE